jgi:hypothetical protein
VDKPRRERIRELIQVLDRVRDEVTDILMDEEASKETGEGQTSSEAIYEMEEANEYIQDAIDHMQSAIADDDQ